MTNRTDWWLVSVRLNTFALLLCLLALNPLKIFGNEVSKTITINLTMQKLSCFEKGKKVATFDISSGVNNATPCGVTKIRAKEKEAYSEKYNTPLPYCCWTDFSDIGIHAGELPGYPASHGCIRLHHKDAIWLFDWVLVGIKVTIY